VQDFDTERWAARRRPFDALERRVVQLHLARPDPTASAALRYALSFARLTQIRTADGTDVDVSGPLALHAKWVREALEPTLAGARSLHRAAARVPELVERTQRSRASLLEHMPLDRAALEAEVTTRSLAVASGGGGGAGYVYPGVYEQLERSGLTPDLMTGTSMGALMSLFRARRRSYDFAALVAAARRLTWSGVFKVLDTANRYGVPAALRLYLRTALGSLFVGDDGEPLRLSGLEIPLHVVATGIAVDGFAHDLDYYEHLLDDEVARLGVRAGLGATVKAIGLLREFLSTPESLERIVLGRDPGTEDFDALDAAGFSSAVPAVIHYDVLRDDPRMHTLLDELYAATGIHRLAEGGMTSNVPARVAWETVVSGGLPSGRRNVFVLALDCFSPSVRRPGWYALQQAVRSANVAADRAFSDLYIAHRRTLSPLNVVPSLEDALAAVRWGSQEAAEHMPFVRAMCAAIPPLPEPA